MSCEYSRLTGSVFVGKLRGRKVAISEFREHLSESELGMSALTASGHQRTETARRVSSPQHRALCKFDQEEG